MPLPSFQVAPRPAKSRVVTAQQAKPERRIVVFFGTQRIDVQVFLLPEIGRDPPKSEFSKE
jgi:hypothetical protein